MRSHFHSIVGWEKFAGEWYLRMKLAEPDLKSVWPGPPTVSEPRGEVRCLVDEVLPFPDVTRALTDAMFRREHGYNSRDLKLLWRAMLDFPGHDGCRNVKRYKVRPEGPVA